MTIAILYRWRADPAKRRQFEDAWAEGTRLIHETCGSYGARLHRGEDGLYWSYALWPDEETRRRCFKKPDLLAHESFKLMQEATLETFDEIRLDPCVDLLAPMPEEKADD